MRTLTHNAALQTAVACNPDAVIEYAAAALSGEPAQQLWQALSNLTAAMTDASATLFNEITENILECLSAWQVCDYTCSAAHVGISKGRHLILQASCQEYFANCLQTLIVMQGEIELATSAAQAAQVVQKLAVALVLTWHPQVLAALQSASGVHARLLVQERRSVAPAAGVCDSAPPLQLPGGSCTVGSSILPAAAQCHLLIHILLTHPPQTAPHQHQHELQDHLSSPSAAMVTCAELLSGLTPLGLDQMKHPGTDTSQNCLADWVIDQLRCHGEPSPPLYPKMVQISLCTL